VRASGSRRICCVGGVDYDVSRSQIEKSLAKVEPESITRVFVIVGNRKFPVKQALAAGAGITRAGFTTQYALRILRKMGFETGEKHSLAQMAAELGLSPIYFSAS